MALGKTPRHKIEAAERLLKERAQAKRTGLMRGGDDAIDYIKITKALMILRRVAHELRRPTA